MRPKVATILAHHKTRECCQKVSGRRTHLPVWQAEFSFTGGGSEDMIG